MIKFLTLFILLLPSMIWADLLQTSSMTTHAPLCYDIRGYVLPCKEFERRLKSSEQIKKDKPKTEFWMVVWDECPNYLIFFSTVDIIDSWDSINSHVMSKRKSRIFHVDKELTIVPVIQEKYELKEK